MQDIDLYVKKNHGMGYVPSFGQEPDMDYYFKAAETVRNDEKTNHKKTNRNIALVTGLVIISFTAGLIVGIKFAGGSERAIVDPHTKKAVTELTASVGTMLSGNQAETVPTSTAYPKEDFPFVIKVGDSLSYEQSKLAANDLSKKGHTVILSKQGELYRLFVGPFKTKDLAENSLQKLRQYQEHSFYRTASVLKRM